jgi:predicted phosphodiesterase
MIEDKQLTTGRSCGRKLLKRRRCPSPTFRNPYLRSIVSFLCCLTLPGRTSSLLNYLPLHDGVNIDGYCRSNRQLRTLGFSSPGLSATNHGGPHNGNVPGVVHLPHINQVLCLSDLHTDHAENLAWLADRTSTTAQTSTLSNSDLIVVAGDISHDMDRLEESFELLLRTGASVLFVPGNHEAWLSSTELKDLSPSSSSLTKLERIYELCTELGVLTGCTVVGGTAGRPHPLWILPLASWYDGSLSIEGCEDLCRDFPKWPWVDFLRCRWHGFPPTNDSILRKIPQGLTEHFLKQNDARVIGPFQSAYGVGPQILQDQAGMMTVSHFLPNRQCLPDWKDVHETRFEREAWLDHGGGGVSAKFALVAGTQLLDEQIRSSCRTTLVQQDGHYDRVGGQDNVTDSDMVGPSFVRHIHVFGHSHRPKDFVLGSVRYIHNPLGKPREREIHMVNPRVDFQLVWDTTSGEVDGDTVIRYWEEKGGGVEMLRERMNKSKRKSRYVHSSKGSNDVRNSRIIHRHNDLNPSSVPSSPRSVRAGETDHQMKKRSILGQE